VTQGLDLAGYRAGKDFGIWNLEVRAKAEMSEIIKNITPWLTTSGIEGPEESQSIIRIRLQWINL
jgi:hypothetical protein